MASHEWLTREEVEDRFARAGWSCPLMPAWSCARCGCGRGKEGDPQPPEEGCLDLPGDAMPP